MAASTSYQVTSSQLLLLLKGGEIKDKSLRTVCLLQQVNGRQVVELNGIEMLDELVITEDLPYPLLINGKTVLESLKFKDCKVPDLSVYGRARVYSLGFLGGSNVRVLKAADSSMIEEIQFSDNSRAGQLLFHGEMELGSFGVLGSSRIDQLRVEGECDLDTIMISEKSVVEKIIFTDNAVIGDINIYGNSTVRYMYFSKNMKVEGQIFLYDRTSFKSIAVSGDAVFDEFNLEGNATIGTLSIRDNARTQRIRLRQESRVDSLSLLGNVEVRGVSLVDDSRVSIISVAGRAQVGMMFFQSDASSGKMVLKGSSEIKGIELSNKFSVNQLCFIDSVKCGHLVITGQVQLKSIYFLGGQITNSVIFTKWKTSSIEMEGAGTIFPNKVILSFCTVDSISFLDFKMSSDLQITGLQSSIETDSNIKFVRSSLGRLELVGNNLSEFDYLVFESSDLTNTFIADTTFPDIIKASPSREDIGADIKCSKLFYEQIKTIYQRQGNRSRALEYQSMELDAHYRIVRLKDNPKDKITLWLNKYSTNFGTDWLRGVGFFFLVSVPLYAILLIMTRKGMTGELFEEYSIWELLTSFFDFINPTSYIWKKWDFVEELEQHQIRPGIKAIMLFSKIFMITVIYQIIQAFRKFGKR